MKSYTQAPDEVHRRIKDLIEKHYSDTLGSDGVSVKIDVLMAHEDEEDTPAVLLNGYPCLAVIRVLNLKDRTMERGDAEIVIDNGKYEAMDPEERDALLDHELYHLELKLDKFDRPKRDAQGRPLLGLKKHDRQFGWFDAIARRHGNASAELQQAHELQMEAGELYFDFAENYAEAGA